MPLLGQKNQTTLVFFFFAFPVYTHTHAQAHVDTSLMAYLCFAHKHHSVKNEHFILRFGWIIVSEFFSFSTDRNLSH